MKQRSTDSIPSRSRKPRAKTRALTLVEAMVSMLIMGMFLLGFLSTSLRSRRVTESNVMQAAAHSLSYGLIEQLKMTSYETIPFTGDTVDPIQTNDAFPDNKPPSPYVGLLVRLNQDQVTSLQCVNSTDANDFKAPRDTPASLSDPALDPAMMNTIGPISLSSSDGTQSQPLTLKVWAWVDDISNKNADIETAKCITLVYAYDYHDGNSRKTVIDREVIVRTKYAPLERKN